MAGSEVPLTALGELAGSVARAIGGPLTAITMAVDRLKTREPEVEESPELKLIQDQVQRMGGLAETLRSLAQPGRGHPVALDMNEIVSRLTGLIREPLETAGIRLVTSPASGLPAAKGDAEQVQEALLALLYNARLALESWDGPREIHVATRVSVDGRVEVCVKDSGPGVPEGEEERIFLPFVSGWGRNGMGLSYSRLALMGQEGELGVEPSEGSGACFAVRLPALDPATDDDSDEETDR